MKHGVVVIGRTVKDVTTMSEKGGVEASTTQVTDFTGEGTERTDGPFEET